MSGPESVSNPITNPDNEVPISRVEKIEGEQSPEIVEKAPKIEPSVEEIAENEKQKEIKEALVQKQIQDEKSDLSKIYDEEGDSGESSAGQQEGSKREQEKKLILKEEITRLSTSEIVDNILNISNRIIQSTVLEGKNFGNDTFFSKEMMIELVRRKSGNAERSFGDSEKLILKLLIEGKLGELESKVREVMGEKLQEELTKMKEKGDLEEDTLFDIERFEDDISVKSSEEGKEDAYQYKTLVSKGEVVE